jgi:hypothetical protein
VTKTSFVDEVLELRSVGELAACAVPVLGQRPRRPVGELAACAVPVLGQRPRRAGRRAGGVCRASAGPAAGRRAGGVCRASDRGLASPVKSRGRWFRGFSGEELRQRPILLLCGQPSGWTAIGVLVRVRVRVTLRLTVSQPVNLGVEPLLGLMTRFVFHKDYCCLCPLGGRAL